MGSDENWLALLKRAEDRGIVEVGVDHFKAARHPQSPFRKRFLYNPAKIAGKVKTSAYASSDNFSFCWDSGFLRLWLADDAGNFAQSPEDSWRHWVKDNLTFLLRGS